ncbi:MAG: hypothetical protein IJS80_05260 [Lachnospiraceae bacterium]|nr:hypothetical protein [Lachnospiraceae bacterium]
MDASTIRKDRMKYSKNKLSSGFALLSILFNVFYFVSIYKSDVGNFYYSILIGASVIYNLLFMLFTFLCSEGVKKYSLGYSIILVVIGVLQIGRIFYLPAKAHSTVITVGGVDKVIMEDGQYARVIFFLLVSAAFALMGGVIGIIKNRTLTAYTKSSATN